MIVAIYIILGLQVVSVSGFILLAIYLKKSNQKYKATKTALQESIKQLILDRIELENKIDNKILKPQSNIDLPNINLN